MARLTYDPESETFHQGLTVAASVLCDDEKRQLTGDVVTRDQLHTRFTLTFQPSIQFTVGAV